MAYGMSDEQLRTGVNAFRDEILAGRMTQQQAAQRIAQAARDNNSSQTTSDIARAMGIPADQVNQWFTAQGINPNEYFGGAGTRTANQASGFVMPVFNALNAVRDQTGPAPTLTTPAPFNFQEDPGYAFRQQQGERGINRAAAARGQFFSGRVGQELSDFNSGLASQEYGNAYNRYLAGNTDTRATQQQQYGQWDTNTNRNLAIGTQASNTGLGLENTVYGRGMDADNVNWARTSQVANSGQGAAGAPPPNNAQYYQAGGNANAAGNINAANAWTQAGNNALGYYAYMNNPWAPNINRTTP